MTEESDPPSCKCILKNGMFIMEFPQYILEMAVTGDSTNSPVCLVHLQSPMGPSSMVPLEKEKLFDAAVNQIFAVPVPLSETEYQYFPLEQHYLSMELNQELEPELRLLWAGDGSLAVLGTRPVQEGCIRITAIRTSLAKVLASTIGVNSRILVAVSKKFSDHAIQFVDAVPDDDHLYVDITQCRSKVDVQSAAI